MPAGIPPPHADDPVPTDGRRRGRAVTANEWGVSLNGVPDAVKDHLVDVLDRELEPLTLAVHRAEDWSYGEAAKFVFLDEPRMRLVDRLKSVRGYLE